MAHKSFEAERKAEGRFSNMGRGAPGDWNSRTSGNGLPRVSVTSFAGGFRRSRRQ